MKNSHKLKTTTNHHDRASRESNPYQRRQRPAGMNIPINTTFIARDATLCASSCSMLCSGTTSGWHVRDSWIHCSIQFDCSSTPRCMHKHVVGCFCTLRWSWKPLPLVVAHSLEPCKVGWNLPSTACRACCSVFYRISTAGRAMQQILERGN